MRQNNPAKTKKINKTLSIKKTHFNRQEVEPTFISQSLGYHGLGATGRTVEQDSLRWLDPHAGEGLWVPEGPLHSLLQLQLYLLHPTYVRPAHLDEKRRCIQAGAGYEREV